VTDSSERVPRLLGLQLLLATLASQATLLTLSPLILEVAAEFGVSVSDVGQLRAVSGLVAGVSSIALTVRPPRTSLRHVILVGLVALTVGIGMSAAAPSFILLAVAQVPVGLGLAFTLGGALAASARWAPPGTEARLLSWALLGQPLAWVFCMPLIGVVAGPGWRYAWLVPLTATVLATAIVARRKDSNECEPPLPLSVLRRDRALQRWALAEVFALSAWAGTLIYCGALFIESYGVSTAGAGFILGGVAVAYLPGNALFRRWVTTSAIRICIGLALALATLSVPFGAVRESAIVSFVLVSAIAFCSGGRTIAGSARGLAVGGERKMGAMSLRTAALQFGYLIGGFVGGVALDAGGYTAVGITFASLFAISGVLYAGSLRSQPETTTRSVEGRYSASPANRAS
jgi:predicted MFS family arabinose efflux permease